MQRLSKAGVLMTSLSLLSLCCAMAAHAESSQFKLTINNSARDADVTLMIPPTIGHSPSLDSRGISGSLRGRAGLSM